MDETTANKRKQARQQADGEWVVLHDMVSYHDFDHEPVPGQPKALLYAKRRQVIGGDELSPPTNQEIKRLEDMGAITADKDTIAAKLALAGQRAEGPLPASYLTLSSPAEQVRAVQAASRYPGTAIASSNKRDLSRLAIGDLKVMAVALGYPDLVESDSKDEIIDHLTGGADDADNMDDVLRRQQARDERQIAAREVVGTQREPGLVGTNVTSAGVAADTGERTLEVDASDEAKETLANQPTRRSRRKSRVQQES